MSNEIFNVSKREACPAVFAHSYWTVLSIILYAFVGQAHLFAQQITALTTNTVRIGLSTTIKVTFSGVEPDLSYDVLLAYVSNTARAVSHYYGAFPVNRAEVQIAVIPGRSGVLQGTTWGDRDGFPAMTRLRIGQHSTETDLRNDWILTHELVHTALPSLPDDQHWLEEGIATYVEPIARFQTGSLTKEQLWLGMVEGMPHGEPEDSDQGLDHTHTWGRTYWGGALFCLIADIQIRKQTNNVYGLQDALAAVVQAHGSIADDWPIERVLTIADKKTGTTVLENLYKAWRATPVNVDLPELWSQLGVYVVKANVTFDDSAPLAKTRMAIMGAR
jgi:hypothetical protein